MLDCREPAYLRRVLEGNGFPRLLAGHRPGAPLGHTSTVPQDAAFEEGPFFDHGVFAPRIEETTDAPASTRASSISNEA